MTGLEFSQIIVGKLVGCTLLATKYFWIKHETLTVFISTKNKPSTIFSNILEKVSWKIITEIKILLTKVNKISYTRNLPNKED